MSSLYYKNQKYTGPTLDLGSGSLTTTNKTIVGGINEINSLIQNVPEIFSTTITLAVADWANDSQTVTVSGVTANSDVVITPTPASASDYTSAGIMCTAQASNSLTFTCTTTPSTAVSVNLLVFS